MDVWCTELTLPIGTAVCDIQVLYEYYYKDETDNIKHKTIGSERFISMKMKKSPVCPDASMNSTTSTH